MDEAVENRTDNVVGDNVLQTSDEHKDGAVDVVDGERTNTEAMHTRSC